MEKILIFIEEKLGFNRLHVQLVLIIFLAAVLSKGAVVFHGYALDDYAFCLQKWPCRLKRVFCSRTLHFGGKHMVV